MKFIKLIIDLTYKFIFIAALISLLIYAVIDYGLSIQNKNLKVGLITLIAIIIFIILILIYLDNVYNLKKAGIVIENSGGNYSHPLDTDNNFHSELKTILEKQIKNLFDKNK